MDRYYPVELTVPASTPPGNPTKQTVPLEDATLVDVEIIVPAGHVALTGIRVLASNQQVIPWGNLSWIKSDNYVRVFDFNAEIGASAISVQGFNNDVIAHTFYARFHMRDRTDPNAGTPSSIIGGLGNIVGTSTGATGIPVGTLPASPPPPLTLPPPIGVPSLPPINLPGTPTPGTTQQAFWFLN